MQDPSPAKLYACLVGGILVIAGVVGFFYSASFGRPGHVGEMFGIFSVNGWLNIVHMLTGAIGLLVAGFAARRYALWLGIAYIAIAIWGFTVGSGGSLIDLIPVNTATNLLHLVLGMLGVGAALGTATGKDGATRPRPGRTKKSKGKSSPSEKPLNAPAKA